MDPLSKVQDHVNHLNLLFIQAKSSEIEFDDNDKIEIQLRSLPKEYLTLKQ
jgi:hypothetical protein